MHAKVIGAMALALLCAASAADGQTRRGVRPYNPPASLLDDEDAGPRPPRVQLFVSPAGQPFRSPTEQPYPAAAWFAAADANHDGRLTREEFRADAERWFAVIDTDKDGQISMPEVTHWEEDLVPEITSATFGGYGGGRGGPLRRNVIDTRAQGAATFSVINEPHPLRGADADFSFTVSTSEWRAAADRRFDLLDDQAGVKNGAILAADLPKTPAEGRPDKRKARR